MRLRSRSNSSEEEADTGAKAGGISSALVRVVHKSKSKSNSTSDHSVEKGQSYKPIYQRQRDAAKRKGSTSGSPKIGLLNQRGRQVPVKNRPTANEQRKSAQAVAEKTAAFIERMRPKPLEKPGSRQNSRQRKQSGKPAQASSRNR